MLGKALCSICITPLASTGSQHLTPPVAAVILLLQHVSTFSANETRIQYFHQQRPCKS